MSLRWRWALILALASAAAIAATTAIALTSVRHQLIRQVDDSLRLRADLARAGSLAPDRFRGPLGGPLRGQIVGFDAVVQGLDAGGRVVIAFEEAPRLPVDPIDLAVAQGDQPPAIRDVEADGAPYRMVTVGLPRRPRVAGASVAALQIGIDVSDVSDTVRALIVRLSAVGAVVVAVAALLGYLIARGTVRPIERLTASAERIAATEDLATPLDTRAPGEVGRLAGAFAAMLEALRRSREQQTRLIEDAGHELRTPLTALRTNLETLRRRGGDLEPAQRLELLDAALAETEEMGALSAELVDLSSDDTAREEAAIPVDLSDLADLVAGRFRRRTGREIVVVEVEHDSEVIGRPAQLDRALTNLLDNAVKWSPASTAVEVTVTGRRIDVRDHGPGIAAEDLPHIFDRFYRSTRGRAKPGSGLGLAIVDHIVTGHGGTVYARNAPDGGAVVGFSLPATGPSSNRKSPAG